MKFQKMICLDADLVERLRQENASSLINTLLKSHFQKTDDPMALMSNDELEHVSAEARLQLKHIEELAKLKKKMLGAKK